MTALSILAIAFSVGAIALCVHIDFLHVENMRHMTNYIGTLEQRIKKLEEEVKKGENDGRMDKG